MPQQFIKSGPPEASGIAVKLQELIDLRNAKFLQPEPASPKQFTSTGQKLTSIRGRGIEFDTTREYQPGDDIRSMAWRVTARSLKPHIKGCRVGFILLSPVRDRCKINVK
jgi:hypothetical protein